MRPATEVRPHFRPPAPRPPLNEPQRLPPERIVATLMRLPSVRELTPTQTKVLLWLCEAIWHRRGSFVEGQGELAAELNCSRRSIVRAVARFRSLDLVHATPTVQHGTGGTDKLRYRLPRWLWLIFYTPEPRDSIGCDRMSPPYPKGTTTRPSKLHPRRESGAATPPERLFCALTGALTACITGSDRRVLLQVSRTLPETYFGAAEALAARISRGEEGEIYAPGAFLRQRLAVRLAADGVPIPDGWNVRPPREAELVEMREQLAASRPAPRPMMAAISTPPIGPSSPRKPSTPDLGALGGLVWDLPDIPARPALGSSAAGGASPPAPPAPPGSPALSGFSAAWRAALRGEN